jgi:hypothetical protein
LEGNHVFALPSCIVSSHLPTPGWGTPAILPSCRRRNATSWKLVPFGHRLASRIFIRQPGCIPSPVVTQDGAPSFWTGRSKPGCDLGSALSFKDVHHPCWGGGRAEPELYLPRGFVGQPPLQHPRERALTSPASGADFDNAGPVDGGCRQLQHVGLAGLAPGAPPAARAVVAPCARVDRPRHRAPLERRSCSRVVLPLQRYGASARRSVLRSSGRIRVGICRWADAPL